jgi:hypothetical protein
MELIATQYRGRARVLQAKLFVPSKTFCATIMTAFYIYPIFYS